VTGVQTCALPISVLYKLMWHVCSIVYVLEKIVGWGEQPSPSKYGPDRYSIPPITPIPTILPYTPYSP
jgi:hypothetical protein